MSIDTTPERAALLRQMADQMDRERYGHGFAAAALREYAALITADLPGVQQAQAPDGWRLVPVEPTPEMRKAAADAWLDCDSRMLLNKAAAAVRAGIKAAPQQGSNT